MDEVVRLLRVNNKYISCMESCTGGAVSNAITNIEGASEVFKYGAVTYSNEYKIKMGVDPLIIDKFSVYSMETARSMSRAISDFSLSNYGIGITGKINRMDVNNLYGEDNVVFISIYDRDMDKYYDKIIRVDNLIRSDNKLFIVDGVIQMLMEILR